MAEAGKLRRGTSSCHECRRRKVRCDFDPGSSGSCTPCRRRRRQCVPQIKQAFDYDASATANQYRKVSQRLVHLEALVDQLLQQPAAKSVRARAETFVGRRGGRPDVVSDTNAGRVPAVRVGGRQNINTNSNRGRSVAQVPPPTSQTAIITTITTTTPSLDSLTRLLRSLFPPPETIALIAARGTPSGPPLRKYKQTNNFLMDSDNTTTTSLTPEPYLDMIPSPTTTNPLTLARKLVELAIYLQQLSHHDSPSANGSAHAAAAACFVDAAARHVASRTDGDDNDGIGGSSSNLLCCVEGIELLMLEGVYHVNEGNWYRGWETFRRALRIAWGLGMGRVRPRVALVDGEGCGSGSGAGDGSGSGDGGGGGGVSVGDDGRVWSRLVYSDRYMSLILGIVPAVTDDSCLGTTMDGTELRRLERVHAIVTGRIAMRNERLRRAGFWDGCVLDEQEADYAYRETLQIDDDMKQAVRLVSPELWFLPASAVDLMPPPAATPAQLKDTTARLFAQLKHFNLLVLVHFPYVMQSLDSRKPPPPSSWPTGSSSSYSTLTAIHASREVLSRFLIYRSLRPAPLHYRGFDLMAITASVILLLAHLDSHRTGYCHGDGGNALDHQRPGHLHMVSCAAACFEALDKGGRDPVSRSAALVLRTLAAVERDAARGVGEYLLWREDGPLGKVRCGVGEEESGGLRFTVPHFGMIRVVRREVVDGLGIGWAG